MFYRNNFHKLFKKYHSGWTSHLFNSSLSRFPVCGLQCEFVMAEKKSNPNHLNLKHKSKVDMR